MGPERYALLAGCDYTLLLPGSFVRPELIGISLCKSTIWIHFVFCVMFFIKMLKKHVVGGLYIYIIYIYYI